MGKVPISQLEKMQELPCRIGTGKNSNRWRNRYSILYHTSNGVDPYKRVKRLLRSSVGKRFDVVFHEYCQQVPQYQQKIFLREFDETKYYRWSYFFVDDNGLIQINEDASKYRGPYTFHSIDYQSEWQHKVTGKPKPEPTWSNKWAVANDEDYHLVITRGWSKVFESKNNPEYKKLMVRKMFELKKRYRTTYRGPSISDEDYRRILRAKELKEREENLIKIQAHGFDPITSFRKEKKQDGI